MEKIKLKILGVTFSQVQTGAYALILKEENGQRRFPVIVGTPEAQSIAIFMDNLTPPRPLTHDLFVSFAKTADIEIVAANIYKYEDGVFYSELVFIHNEKELRIDSRTSDAVAIAIRLEVPVYTTEEIMREVSVVLEDDDLADNEDDTAKNKISYDIMNIEDLQKKMNDAIINEDYEKASHIRDLINKRTR
ncbi:MAG: bifunctional nuclease family protein [Dysgonamonadaceae bacterium]|nr:bifunctional nuclease family protein [Dysgonamonadaceae bacterium]